MKKVLFLVLFFVLGFSLFAEEKVYRMLNHPSPSYIINENTITYIDYDGNKHDSEFDPESGIVRLSYMDYNIVNNMLIAENNNYYRDSYIIYYDFDNAVFDPKEKNKVLGKWDIKGLYSFYNLQIDFLSNGTYTISALDPYSNKVFEIKRNLSYKMSDCVISLKDFSFSQEVVMVDIDLMQFTLDDFEFYYVISGNNMYLYSSLTRDFELTKIK